MRRFLPLLPLLSALALCAPARAQTATEPQAFLYTAVWDETSDDFYRTTVQRIPLPYTQYEEFKQRFIDVFVELIAETQAMDAEERLESRGSSQNEADSRVMAEFRLSLDPNVKDEEGPLILAFDVEPVSDSIAAGTSPRTLGEWTFYFWQFSIWEYYVSKDTLLLDDFMTLADVSRLDRVVSGRREPVWTWTEIDPADDEPKEWIQVQTDPTPIEEPTPEEEAAIETLIENAFDGGVIRGAQDPEIHKAEYLGMYRLYRQAALAVTAEEHDTYYGLIDRLRERQEDRDRYYAWLEDRRRLVIDFTEEWARKFDGSEFNVDGVMYLVSVGEPLMSVPRNARNVVIDRVVTPYDLLEDSGRLKKPIEVED
jgi:hypothetical protein